MEMASPGALPVYHTLPGPLATQQGALVGNAGAGPTIGKMSRSGLTIAKLSGLCAGVNPRLSPQKPAPNGVLLAAAGSETGADVPLSAPSRVRGSCNREPDFNVTAPHVQPTAICPADVSGSFTTPSVLPVVHQWLSAQFAPTTNTCSWPRATESGCTQPEESLNAPARAMESSRLSRRVTVFEPKFATAPTSSLNCRMPPLPPAPPIPPVGNVASSERDGVPLGSSLNTTTLFELLSLVL